MTGIGDPVNETSFARLDALAERGRRRSPVADGAGFDQLLADAKSRLMSRLPSGSALASAPAGYDTRPAGALGMATPSARSAPSSAAASPAQETEPAEIQNSVAHAGTQSAGVLAAKTTTAEISIAGPSEIDGATPTGAEPVAPTSPSRTAGVDDVTSTTAKIDPAITKADVSAAGEAILRAVLDQIDAPYLEGGDGPDSGFDAAGLVRYAHRSVGVEMPADLERQATMGVPIESLADALPGDLITFGQPADHVAIYAGSRNIVHAPSPGEAVRLEDIERPVESIRRVVMPGPSATTLDRFSPGEIERRYQPLFDAAGADWEVAPELLAAIAQVESGFDPTAVSPVGAQGLMQFMPATAREMDVDPWNPASAIDGAARYIRTSLDQFDEPELAIASYNAGRGAVSRYGGIPPFNETQNYVQKVLDAWRSRS